MNLHKLLYFYLLIFIPLTFIVALIKIGLLSSSTFTIGLFFYALTYHPFISGKRLLALLRIIDKLEFINNFITFWNFKYFDILFFKK